MIQTEHLAKIRAKCQHCLDNGRDNGIDKWTGPAEAGWKSTIAAIDGLQSLALETALYPGHCGSPKVNHHLDSIIAAWPEELL